MTQYVSRATIEKLKKRLEGFLKERDEIIERLNKSATFGDLTENAEYQQAREEKERIDVEILKLKNKMGNLKVRKKKRLPKETIDLYSKVKAEGDGVRIEFTLVPPDEIEISKKRFSIESPFGKAFLEKRKGDKVEVETPTGKKTYRVLDVA